jgi:hypothetical protein
MAGAELILCMVRLPPGRVFGWLACAFLLAPLFAEAGNPARAKWFPDQPSTPRFDWTYTPCEGCRALHAKPEWKAMARLAGLENVHFLLAPNETSGPAYSFAPNAVVIAPSALKLGVCHLSFLIGHEIVHLAQRHFDEDALAAATLSGKPQSWTRKGAEAMQLLEDNFILALRMSDLWQQQEREADWVGALLAAQACRCSIEDSALSYLRKDTGYGGGVAAAHETSASRVRFLQAFNVSAKRLATWSPHRAARLN